MTCQALVQRIDNDGYRATALGLPDCVATGETRDEALANLKAAVSAQLANGEIVSLQVEGPESPWTRWFGMFNNDPTYDDFLAEVAAYRREVDARERERADVPAGH